MLMSLFLCGHTLGFSASSGPNSRSTYEETGKLVNIYAAATGCSETSKHSPGQGTHTLPWSSLGPSCGCPIGWLESSEERDRSSLRSGDLSVDPLRLIGWFLWRYLATRNVVSWLLILWYHFEINEALGAFIGRNSWLENQNWKTLGVTAIYDGDQVWPN